MGLPRDAVKRKDWYTFAQLPQAAACSKILRYLHWTTWLEFLLLVAVIVGLIGWMGAPLTPRASYNALNRYRMALIGMFAVATALQMWAANVLLNLADSDATDLLGKTEVTRARVTLIGYCATAAFNALLIITLGDDGEPSAYEVLHPDVTEPLVSCVASHPPASDM
ncbi:g139 [Coccomyxa viridis]|uniref:G139 protein n=1 Tax=Coccomyxa viridis TaxID=1274662 RepID=A0ABP1FK50_9CHLO